MHILPTALATQLKSLLLSINKAQQSTLSKPGKQLKKVPKTLIERLTYKKDNS